MEPGPIDRVSLHSPSAMDAVQDAMTELLAAVHSLNRLEFMGRGQQLKLRRPAKGKRSMVDLLDSETGEVLDEFPPDEVLRMMSDLAKERVKE